MSLVRFRAIAARMAKRANRLDIVMMISPIPAIMVVFVPPLPLAPDMTAIDTRQRVRVRPMPCPDLAVEILAGLNLVAVAWGKGSGAGHA